MEGNFYQAYMQANLLYGVELLPEDFEELGLIAWNFIGNKRSRLYRFCGKINCFDLSLELPCNAEIIEAVTYSTEDWNYTTNTSPNGDLNSQFTENYIEGRKLFNDPLYISGKYAKFQQINNVLYFDRDYGTVNVLYRGTFVDEDGLPFINDKESVAIACFIAYHSKFKEGLMTHNQLIIQESQLLEQRWYRLCDAARVPVHFSQNDMNEILDAKSSWNRKIYGKSYKPVR